MRMTRSCSVRQVRRALGAVTLAGVIALVLAEGRAASALTRSSTALYYESQSSAGVLSIDELDLSAPGPGTRVVDVGNVSVFGIALGGRYLYWSTESGPHDRGAIMRASITGAHVRRLVGDLSSAASVIAVDGYVYWSDRNAIGRVALDGTDLRRRFIELTREGGGGVADGLASDGAHLYFSRCDKGTIGRSDLNGSHVEPRFISLGARTCPQGLAVAGTHLYWTQLGSGTIGRARSDGRDTDGRWLNVRTHQGPFQVVADGAHVYWTWGGVDGSPSYTGRADTDRSHLDRRFLPGSLYPMALSGTG